MTCGKEKNARIIGRGTDGGKVRTFWREEKGRGRYLKVERIHDNGEKKERGSASNGERG